MIISTSVMKTNDYLNQHTGQLKEKDRFEIKFFFTLIDTAYSISRNFCLTRWIKEEWKYVTSSSSTSFLRLLLLPYKSHW